MIIKAVKRAVQISFEQTPIPKAEAEAAAETPQPKTDRVHETDDDSTKATPAVTTTDPQMELKAALLAKFGSAKLAHKSFCKNGTIGKKEWRRVIRKVLPSMTVEDAKALRKKLPKNASLAKFVEWIGEENTSVSESPSSEATDLADLPVEVPLLPPSFKPRPHAHEQLVFALIDSSGRHSTSVTAPRSRVSSQGMGGVGKTMLTSAVIRDERVRRAFEKIACE